MQDLSVCSCFSAADSEIYVQYIAGYVFDFGLVIQAADGIVEEDKS